MVTRTTSRVRHEPVYNLTVDGVHTYYVGDTDSILVHNSACDDWAQANLPRVGGKISKITPNTEGWRPTSGRTDSWAEPVPRLVPAITRSS